MLRHIPLLAVTALGISAAPITVTNFSFELGAIGSPGGFSGTHPGWTGGVVFRPTVIQVPAVPLGIQVMYLAGDSNTVQTLTDTLASGLLYTLQVEVGSRADSIFINNYAVSLEAGANVLASVTSPTPANGAFTSITLQYSSTAASPGLGQALAIRLSHTGPVNSSAALLDNVRLDASASNPVPEPSSLALLGLGLAVIARYKYR